MREGFVGVHIGAGQHAESRTQLYLSICSEACKVAVDVLREGGGALEAACRATMVLENAGETNAGYGSNLTESGTVEMGRFWIHAKLMSIIHCAIKIAPESALLKYVTSIFRCWNNGWQLSSIWCCWSNAWH